MDRNHELTRPVDACLARICALGCAAVYRTIERFEAGEEVAELEDMDIASRQAVVEELKAVMAVYGARGGSTACGTDSSA